MFSDTTSLPFGAVPSGRPPQSRRRTCCNAAEVVTESIGRSDAMTDGTDNDSCSKQSEIERKRSTDPHYLRRRNFRPAFEHAGWTAGQLGYEETGLDLA